MQSLIFLNQENTTNGFFFFANTFEDLDKMYNGLENVGCPN